MVRVDHGLGVGQVGERVLHDLCEALAALGLVGDVEVDVGRTRVLLRLRLQELAAGQVQLNLRALFLLFLPDEGLLVDPVKVFVHEVVIVNVLRHLNEVDQLEVLVQELLS